MRERERGAPACGLERGYLAKNRRRKLTKVPVQPPREERAREYMPTKEMKEETKAESERAGPARDTRKPISIKERRANFGKQMKSRVRHLV